MLDRRQDSRVSQNKRGLIKFGSAGTELPCTINDLTRNGAGLSVGTTFGLPRTFRLAIDGDPVARYCRVIWTDGKKIGVMFD